MRNVLLGLALGLGMVGIAEAATPVTMLPSRGQSFFLPEASILEHVKASFPTENYKSVRVQPVFTESGTPDHLLIYLHSKTQHRVELAAVKLDEAFGFKGIEHNYQLQQSDEQQSSARKTPVCPDPTVEFVSIAPNDDDFEQGIAIDVADAAEAANLKTVRLIGSDATSQNWLNYMSCPKLRGNFYDGDANTQIIVTYDGEISYRDFNTSLKGKFNLQTTNIWLACEAFNNPLKPALITSAKSRKYAAGVNDLEVGPSDDAAACAMKAAIAGEPMTAAFQSCYEQFDNSSDHWGFDGTGSDNFWD